jgi:SEC-C motif-containing protein
MSKKKSLECPCGGVLFSDCCEPFLLGKKPAGTAEQLMRSRYSAYTRNLDAYLLATWHSSTRPQQLNTREEGALKWLGLTVGKCETSGDTAHVSFVARFREPGGGAAQRLKECSRFLREGGLWFYVDGEF